MAGFPGLVRSPDTPELWELRQLRDEDENLKLGGRPRNVLRIASCSTVRSSIKSATAAGASDLGQETYQVSQRRACGTFGVARSSVC
jgi:hypothetical protein